MNVPKLMRSIMVLGVLYSGISHSLPAPSVEEGSGTVQLETDCELTFDQNDSEHFRPKTLKVEEVGGFLAQSGYVYTDEQINRITKRCLGNQEAVVKIVNSDNELACHVGLSEVVNFWRVPYVMLMPEKEYYLSKNNFHMHEEESITLCGIHDILQPQEPLQENTDFCSTVFEGVDNCINGKPVDIPPADTLTKLTMNTTHISRGHVMVAGISVRQSRNQPLFNVQLSNWNHWPRVNKLTIKDSYLISDNPKYMVRTGRSGTVDIKNSVLASSGENIIQVRGGVITTDDTILIHTGPADNHHIDNIAIRHFGGASAHLYWIEKALNRYTNTKIAATDVGNHLFTGIKNSHSAFMLVQNVEFSEGVTTPIELGSPVKFDVGSVNNTWVKTAGDVAHTACSDTNKIESGFAEFKNGDICGENPLKSLIVNEQQSTVPPTTPDLLISSGANENIQLLLTTLAASIFVGLIH